MRNHRTTLSVFGASILSLTAALFATATASASTVYDAVTGFSGVTNPNGVWSYYRNGILFSSSQGSATNCCSIGLPGWWSGLPLPDSMIILQNATGSTFNWVNVIFPPAHSLWLDPEAGNLAVVFTAPSPGTYNIAGDFLGVDTTGNPHPVQVLKNGVAAWSGTISSYLQDDPFNFPAVLNTGDTISFYVGTGSAGCAFCFLSTGLKATVTLGGVFVPPPLVSHVSAFPATPSPVSFTVQWSGTAPGIGIRDYTIYVSDNGGPFTPWQTATTATQALYSGVVGHTYGFYSIATDNVGTQEAAKTAAEATTTVAATGPVYDIVAGFAGATNPNGVWSYYRNGNLFPNSLGSATNCCSTGLPGWFNGMPVPNNLLILQNATGSTFNWLNVIFPPTNSLWLDPEAGNLAVVFTAPSGGTYNIAGDFLGIDTRQNSHPVQVLKNDVAAWIGTISSYGQDDPFSFPVVLNVGDTISFYVGTGTTGCTYCFLSTGLKATITLGGVSGPTPPVSHVGALPATALSTNFTVQWSGTAPGIGIRDYTIYVSDNGAAFLPWLTATTATQAVYAGAAGHSYGFYSIATDTAGTRESAKAAAEATTRVPSLLTSRVAPLAATVASPDITLHWSSAPGLSIAGFTIYVSDNGGPFTPWRSATLTTEGVFHGAAGHWYGFYSIATDVGGNRENPKTVADAVIQILAKRISRVLELPFTAAALSFPVQWSPIAPGAVIRSYTIYISDNGGPFIVWIASTTATQAAYSGVCGHTYGFYSIAIDALGIQETAKSVADAVTRTPSNPVSRVAALPASVTSPNFNVQWSGSDTCSTIQAYDIYVSDNGGPFARWLSHMTAANAYYSGVVGHRYGFYSIAIVATGSREPAKTVAEATTQTPSQSVGDITGDGRVDCADATIVRGSVGKVAGQQFYDARADINGDGVVDAKDLAIVTQLMAPGTRCP